MHLQRTDSLWDISQLYSNCLRCLRRLYGQYYLLQWQLLHAELGGYERLLVADCSFI